MSDEKEKEEEAQPEHQIAAGENPVATTTTENLPKEEFIVDIRWTSHGRVRIRARNKDEARSVVTSMSRARLAKFYKEQFKFVLVGDVTKPAND